MEHSVTVKRLKEYFDRMPEVRLVFLFGSAATQKLRADSDIDVAVQLRQVPDVFELQALQEDLADKMQRTADLVVLNQASPILRMQVLKHGIPVLIRQQREYTEFFTNTVNQYDDLKRIRHPIEQRILQGKT